MHITINEDEYQELMRVKRNIQSLISHKKSLLESARKYQWLSPRGEQLFYEVQELEDLLK